MFALPSPPFVIIAECSHHSTKAFLSRLLRDQWCEIASAPRDREIELAMIDGCIIICICAGPCLRHGAG